MSFSTLSLLTLALKFSAEVAAQTTTALEPLASKHFAYGQQPYQVTGDQGGQRGPQIGYNICNSTTQGPTSLCQTAIINSIDDWCFWSSNFLPTDPLDTIADSEAREVAWCTKPNWGGRQIPAGAITGLQWLYAKNYQQLVGYIDQTQVHLQADDEGGELDPHGADGQGNPLGGIVYTNSFGMNAAGYAKQLQSNSTPSTTFTQVIEWIDFIGGNMFCIKICNPDDPDAPNLCQHIYDRIGCGYNALADYAAINGTFEVCDSDDMTPPGVFTTNGATTTWFQPPEGVVPTPPYTPTLPSSSNCQTFSSAQLFGTAGVSSSAGATGAAATGSNGSSGASGSRTAGTSGSTATQTGSHSAALPNINTTPLFLVAATTFMTMIVSLAV